jgi:hypothetical protein
VSKDIGLAHHHLLSLGKEKGGDFEEIRRQELAGGGLDVDEAEQGSFVQGLNGSYYFLGIGTVLATVKEDGNVGVRGH